MSRAEKLENYCAVICHERGIFIDETIIVMKSIGYSQSHHTLQLPPRNSGMYSGLM